MHLKIMKGTVRIGGRIITNLRFADYIDGLAGKEDELENLVKTVETASTAHGMEINSEKKAKIMSNKADGFTKNNNNNNNNNNNKPTKVKDYNLETVSSFKYLGAIVTDEGTKREVLTRTAQATSVLTKPKTVLKDRKHHLQTQDPNTSFNSHINLPLRM